jgi:hypothetical protein
VILLNIPPVAFTVPDQSTLKLFLVLIGFPSSSVLSFSYPSTLKGYPSLGLLSIVITPSSEAALKVN